MIPFIGHPGFERLSRYADGEFTGSRRDRIAAHLAACDRCRDTIRFIRELGDVARRLPEPEPPADALDRLLARRAAGERVLLPTADPVPVDIERRHAIPTIAAMLAFVVVGSLLVSVPRLRADRSRLDFEPERPRAGTTVRVRYESGALLRSESTLVLRGRIRYRNGNAEIVEAARLARGSDGAFHGTLTLPDSAAYAAFAVEDTAASRVDSNSRRLWELVVHDRDGRPTFDALRERTNDLVYRNWELAYETARTMTRLYPDRPWAWRRLLSFERALVQNAGRDSLLQAYRERLYRLDRLWRQSEPDADDAAALALFAMVLDENDILLHWREYLLREAPDNPTSIQFALFDTTRDTTAKARLADFERLWDEGKLAHPELALAAVSEALRAKDAPAAYRWADRYIRLNPRDLGAIAESLARSLPSDEMLFDWLAKVMTAIRSGTLGTRELHETEALHRQKLNELAGTLHGVMSRAYRAANRPDEALEHLLAAADAKWDPAVFYAAARALAEQGHSIPAAEFFARVAIDPLADSMRVAEAVEFGRKSVGELGWDRAMSRARDRLALHMNLDATYRRIPSELVVLGSGGDPTTANAALAGHTTLVAFWSPMSAPAVAALPDIERTARLLRRHGVRMVGIYVGDLSDRASRAWQDAVPSAPLYFDPGFEAAAAFENWGTPEYFVVDQAGIIRFQHTTLEAAARKATTLVPRIDQIRLVAP
ncbi:MAG TPA: zf-HC2 domain-containing protein [Longimicrobiales bacterium]